MSIERIIEILLDGLKKHNDDCLLCAVKDTRINEALKELSDPNELKRLQNIIEYQVAEIKKLREENQHLQIKEVGQTNTIMRLAQDNLDLKRELEEDDE